MNSSLVSDHFYRAFEDRHRGSRELIKQRLHAYLPFMIPVAALNPSLAVLDVGCGRGEWLELLRDHAISSYGVDLDEGMLDACFERGLRVIKVDALAHLSSLANDSLLAVTGFHIAEHLPFDMLQALFFQALRVLVPGGLLILETPNPENLLVGAANFYLDPSHQRPLPSQLLTFLAEHQGFDHVSHLRLQEEERLANNGLATLYDVLGNVSPDYAIVARVPLLAKAQLDESQQFLEQQLAQAFEAAHGVSLLDLASRYDDQLQVQANSLLQTLERTSKDSADQIHSLNLTMESEFKYSADQFESLRLAMNCRFKNSVDQFDLLRLTTDGQFKLSADQLDSLRQTLNSLGQAIQVNSKETSDQVNLLKEAIGKESKGVCDQVFQLTAHIQQLNQHLGHMDSEIQQAHSQIHQLFLNLAAIHDSRSWRITQPLRWLGRLLHRISGKG